MVVSNPLDLVFWANMLAGSAVLFYAYFMWFQVRGILHPSPRLVYWVRFGVLFCLMTPIAARYQYSAAAILYLSTAMVAVGLLIKLKRRLGI